MDALSNLYKLSRIKNLKATLMNIIELDTVSTADLLYIYGIYIIMEESCRQQATLYASLHSTMYQQLFLMQSQPYHATLKGRF